MVMIEHHDTDGFTLSEYVMNKYGHELYIKTRYMIIYKTKTTNRSTPKWQQKP
jgi:hypothetical protein